MQNKTKIEVIYMNLKDVGKGLLGFAGEVGKAALDDMVKQQQQIEQYKDFYESKSDDYLKEELRKFKAHGGNAKKALALKKVLEERGYL